MTAQQLYTETVCSLSADERLKLAAIILNDLAGSSTPVIGDAPDGEDERELSMFALQYAALAYPEENSLAWRR